MIAFVKSLRTPTLAVIACVALCSFAEGQYQATWTNNGQAAPTNQQSVQTAFEQILSGYVPGQASNGQVKNTAVSSSPGEILAQLASMSQEELLAFLDGVGEMLKQETGQDCNVFGGKDYCKTLPSDSEFAQLCPNHDLRVDCMLYQEELQEVQFNPVKDLKKAIEAAQEQDLESKCPECFRNQLDWLCSSAVPKCGSRRAAFENSFIPAFTKVMEAQKQGKDWAQALAAEAPVLNKANSLVLPCREMCDAIVSTCACGKEKTFGQLLQDYSASQTREALPASLNKDLLNGLSNVSFCSLYASESEPGFSGVCKALPTRCSNQEGWCDPNNPAPTVALELMLRALTDSISSYASIYQEFMDSIFGTSSGTPLPPPSANTGSKSTSSSSWAGISLAFLGGAATCGLLAAGFLFYRQKRLERSRNLSQDSGTEMAENEGLLERA